MSFSLADAVCRRRGSPLQALSEQRTIVPVREARSRRCSGGRGVRASSLFLPPLVPLWMLSMRVRSFCTTSYPVLGSQTPMENPSALSLTRHTSTSTSSLFFPPALSPTILSLALSHFPPSFALAVTACLCSPIRRAATKDGSRTSSPQSPPYNRPSSSSSRLSKAVGSPRPPPRRPRFHRIRLLLLHPHRLSGLTTLINLPLPTPMARRLTLSSHHRSIERRAFPPRATSTRTTTRLTLIRLAVGRVRRMSTALPPRADSMVFINEVRSVKDMIQIIIEKRAADALSSPGENRSMHADSRLCLLIL